MQTRRYRNGGEHIGGGNGNPKSIFRTRSSTSILVHKDLLPLIPKNAQDAPRYGVTAAKRTSGLARPSSIPTNGMKKGERPLLSSNHSLLIPSAPSQMCTHDVESQAQCSAERQTIGSFDFDGLPLPRASRSTRSDSGAIAPPSMVHYAASTPLAPSPAPGESEKPSRVHFADSEPGRERTTARRPQGQQDAPPSLFRQFLGVIQQKCGPKNVAMQLLGSRGAACSAP